MKHLELHRFKKAIGAITFGLFFPNENKRLEQKHGIGKQLDLVLVTPGTQTNTVTHLRLLTGWTVKKATAFFKEGDYPKVVTYNVNPDNYIEVPDAEKGGIIKVTIDFYIKDIATKNDVIFEIY
jgi:hypothetical protein